MKKLLIIFCIISGLTLAGCFDYVQPLATETSSESAQATESELLVADDKDVEETEETALNEPQSVTEVYESESEVETERETVTIYVTKGVNIRSQQTALSDRLGGAGLGDSFNAYVDSLDDEFVEILFEGESAYMYSPCITTNYDVVAQIKAEQAARARQTETQRPAQTETQPYSEVTVETETVIAETETETQPATETQSAIYSASYFKQAGVLNWGGSKWTWYSEKILPGEGLYIPGRHLDENGYVCDENGYICCAADLSYIPRYTVIETPLGKLGKIYDTGCAYGVIDIYCNWLP